MQKYLFFLGIVLLQLFVKAENISYREFTPKSITVFWDTSLSMVDKDIQKELTLLDQYFHNFPNLTVNLITLDCGFAIQKTFTIRDADWKTLRETLENIEYDGVACFNTITKFQNSEVNFLFTDGIEVLDNLECNNNLTYIISSSKKVNPIVINKQTTNTKIKYINLYKVSMKEALVTLNISTVKDTNNNIIASKKINSRVLTESYRNHIIHGVVYSSNEELMGATINIKGKNQGVITDNKGKFSIKVNLGDILEVRYIGMKTKEIPINSYENIDIIILENANELDEVVLKANKKEEIDVGRGKIDKNRVGYEVQTISGDKLNKGTATDISTAARGKISGVTSYGQNDDISQMVFRANSILSNVYPLIIIDGTPIARSNSATGGKIELTNFINPDYIDNITILKGLAATNQWGSEGSNGVILITTKASVSGKKKKSSYYDRALLKNNDFTEKLDIVTTTSDEKYIDEFKGLDSLTNVYQQYLKQRPEYLDDSLYFVNISEFVGQWKYNQLTSKILSNIIEISPDNVNALKILAYKAEQLEDYTLAKKIYQKLVKLRPYDAQSYRDLALIYQETHDFQDALTIYKNILNNNYQNVDFSGIQKSVDNELKRLLLKHKNQLNLEGIPEQYILTKDMEYDARIVFDWNDITADFELQFVNPQQKFFTWSHTQLKNKERLNKEKKSGYNSEEFLLIDVGKGLWQINIENKTTKRNKPEVIKYTLYRNYGKINEVKECKFLILNNIKGKKMLGLINI